MQKMRLEQDRIQLLFDRGEFKKVVITAVPLEKETYTVAFIDKKGKSLVCVKARTDEERVFKSMKAAVSFIQRIGFKSNIEVQL
jgi:hypothetical protein